MNIPPGFGWLTVRGILGGILAQMAARFIASLLDFGPDCINYEIDTLSLYALSVIVSMFIIAGGLWDASPLPEQNNAPDL